MAAAAAAAAGVCRERFALPAIFPRISCTVCARPAVLVVRNIGHTIFARKIAAVSLTFPRSSSVRHASLLTRVHFCC